jgi:hypothetical protein
VVQPAAAGISGPFHNFVDDTKTAFAVADVRTWGKLPKTLMHNPMHVLHKFCV